MTLTPAFRVLVFGDYLHDPIQLREWVEDINQWKGDSRPWEIVLPKCNELLRKNDLTRLTTDERQNLFVRCAVSLDLECLGYESSNSDTPIVDLIVGIRQGATFAVASLTMVELRARTYFLIGGTTYDGMETRCPLIQRVIFANHITDLIEGCPSRELTRLDKQYQEARDSLVKSTVERKEGYFGYATMGRQDFHLLLEQHRELVLEIEQNKRLARTKIPPLSHCFDPSVVAANLTSDYFEVISDPAVVAVVSGMVKPIRTNG